MTEKFTSVWDAIEDTPQAARNMKIRADLMMVITREVEKMRGTQTQKAKQLGMTQPRLNDLLQGRINKFSLDALVTIATRVGLSISIQASVSHDSKLPV